MSIQQFNFETSFLKDENLFHKTGVLFIAESTKTENATFPYNTALSEIIRALEIHLGNCRRFCRGKQCFYSYYLGKNIAEVIIS